MRRCDGPCQTSRIDLYYRSMKFILPVLLIACPILCGLFGCVSKALSPLEGSPLGSVVSGETRNVEDYLKRVEEKNIEDQREAQFEVGREEERVYNLKSGKYEYLSKDAEKRWNEDEQRWEF